MKQKNRSQYVLSLGASALMVYLLLLVPSSASAANLTWSADTSLSFTAVGSGLSLTVVSGSTAASLVVNPGLATLVVNGGDAFTVRDSTGSNTISVQRTDISAQTGFTITCTTSSSTVLFNTSGTYTFSPTLQSPQTNCPGGGGGATGSAPSAPSAPAPAPQDQKPAETVKPTEPAQQTKVEQPAEEKTVALLKVADLTKSLAGIARNGKVDASENAAFGLAVASLNASANALGLKGEIKAETKAKPRDLSSFATKLDGLQKAQVAVDAAAKKAKDVKAAVDKLVSFLKDKKLSAAEVKAAPALLKAAGVTAKVTTKSNKTFLTSIEQKAKTSLTAANKAVTSNRSKVKTQTKSLQTLLTKLAK